ncbi:hypothetical protein [Actinomadura sp. HBU206391]|uniref:hypothetical protein n=1 Tax=Actinomadura sp. HBU206391 TaxID=2731692 RepID=UPI0016505F47|nr:hypothetical protein [Actinomadura sp. HBU206391]MBC6461586.1 hypothetical protein [Actinomadura sp. HBU206391]
MAAVEISRMGANGRFTHRWTLADELAVLSQLGLPPSAVVVIGGCFMTGDRPMRTADR